MAICDSCFACWGLEPGRLVLFLWHALTFAFWGGGMVAHVSYHFSSVQLAMRGLLSWFVVQLMPSFSLIDSELTCWGLLDVHSPEGGPSNPPQ